MGPLSLTSFLFYEKEEMYTQTSHGKTFCEHESGLWSDMVMPKIDPRTSETEGDAQDRFFSLLHPREYPELRL